MFRKQKLTSLVSMYNDFLAAKKAAPRGYKGMIDGSNSIIGELKNYFDEHLLFPNIKAENKSIEFERDALPDEIIEEAAEHYADCSDYTKDLIQRVSNFMIDFSQEHDMAYWFEKILAKIDVVKDSPHLLEVGAGQFGLEAIALKSRFVKNKITVMDPRNIVEPNNMPKGVKVKEEKFLCDFVAGTGKGYKLKKGTSVVAHRPCAATEHIPIQCSTDKKHTPFFIALCPDIHPISSDLKFTNKFEWFDYLNSLFSTTKLVVDRDPYLEKAGMVGLTNMPLHESRFRLLESETNKDKRLTEGVTLNR